MRAIRRCPGASSAGLLWDPYRPRRRPSRGSPPAPAAHGRAGRRAPPRPAYRADVLQAVLTHEGLQPHQARVKESQRRLARGRELPDVELQVGYHTIAGCAQSGAREIEACLLERGERLADLRIVGALWAERLARLLQRGLRTLHLCLGRVQLRPRLVAFRLCVDASAHQLEDPARLLAN